MCAKKGKTILIRQDDYVCNTANISNEFKMKSIILKIYSDKVVITKFKVSTNNNSSRFIVLVLYIT